MSARILILLLAALVVLEPVRAGARDHLGAANCSTADSTTCTAQAPDGGPAGQAAGDVSSAGTPAACDTTCATVGTGQGILCGAVAGVGRPCPAGPSGSGATAEDLAKQAEATLGLPRPAVHLSPQPPVRQKVGLPMWVWVDPAQWQALSATAAAGPVSATATAEPLQLIIDPGTGDPPVVCRGPGPPYDYSRTDEAQHSDCTYTFPRSSARQPNLEFVVKVSLGYHVTWSARGVPGGGDLGLIAGPPQSIPVQVVEIQIVNGR